MTTAGSDDGGCIFCDHLAEGDDESARILYRGERTFVILNAFPYNTGHLMVAPLRHLGDICDLDEDERAELMRLTTQSVAIIREAMGAHGFNVGINLGIVAGAGIPGHIHVHVVPRWGGDTNFMPVVGDTKVLPEMIDQTDAKLRPAFAALNS
ncbi:MAG: HIT family protein [Actinomycetota bacterium]